MYAYYHDYVHTQNKEVINVLKATITHYIIKLKKNPDKHGLNGA